MTVPAVVTPSIRPFSRTAATPPGKVSRGHAQAVASATSGWAAALAAALLTLGVGLAHAQSTQPAAVAVPEAEAQALLARIQDAASKLDYSGIFTYQQGETIQSSRVVHVVDGSGERERIEVLDGQPREYLRRNDDIQCLVPEHKTILVQHKRAEQFPGLLLGSPAALTKYYRVLMQPAPHRVAGRECRIITIEPLDKDRYGYRLCADTENDLLLKAQTLSGNATVLEQVAFTALRLGPAVDHTQLESHWNTKDWKVLQGSMTPLDLAAQGWRIPYPPGFNPVSQVGRTMAHGDAVSQLVLSDGLAAISVFIEPYDKKRNRHQPHGAYRRGPINVYGMRIADYWVTVLGEVPAATLEQLAKATEYVPPAAPPK
ncbi:siderophore-interacting protein [Bordetella genomosp. 9]|uniref:Siderophore-interacting protein n=1 Tax=Bordetella genomosp. 9 TaxID=1416803 RepID=A0A261REL1_9BORD|nr:MucB/RseB C-terminal domain-containing protein [Bordetella genomosp. 9]OZI23371.1 siderophore-interacting protein [Bordetella genomosp. 9]